MLRNCVRVSSRLAISAVISWTLIPIASADAPSPPNNAAAQPAATQPDASSETTAEVPTKVLHTVPEDGIGDLKWLSGATRFVRETVAKRPKEDLVICIGGCVPYQDRIVYAQPSEYVPPRKSDDQISDVKPKAPEKIPAAVAAPNKSDDVKPDSKSAKAPAADMPTPSANSNAAPDAAKAAIGTPAKSEGMAPTAEPKNAVVTPAAKPAAEPASKPVTAPVATPAATPAVTPNATPVAPAAKSVAIPPATPAAVPTVAAPSAAPAPTAPVASESKPALAPAATAARPEDMKKLEFVPSMAGPKSTIAPEAGALDDKTSAPQDPAKALIRKGADAAPAPVVVPK